MEDGRIVDGLVRFTVRMVAQPRVVAGVDAPRFLGNVDENVFKAPLQKVRVGVKHWQHPAAQRQPSSKPDAILLGYANFVVPFFPDLPVDTTRASKVCAHQRNLRVRLHLGNELFPKRFAGTFLRLPRPVRVWQRLHRSAAQLGGVSKVGSPSSGSSRGIGRPMQQFINDGCVELPGWDLGVPGLPHHPRYRVRHRRHVFGAATFRRGRNDDHVLSFCFCPRLLHLVRIVP